MCREARQEGRHCAGFWRRSLGAIRQFFYGMTTYEMVRGLERERTLLEWELATLTQGSLLGLPLPCNPYSLRLLPHLLPQLARVRRATSRTRDIIDLCEEIG